MTPKHLYVLVYQWTSMTKNIIMETAFNGKHKENFFFQIISKLLSYNRWLCKSAMHIKYGLGKKTYNVAVYSCYHIYLECSFILRDWKWIFMLNVKDEKKIIK